eukprot:2627844-Pleurochrysis_carterae.AAC.1
MHGRPHGRNGVFYCNGFNCSRTAPSRICVAHRAVAAGGSPGTARARARSARLWATRRMRFLYVRAPASVSALASRGSV